jgi:hypothetical protein
LSSIFLSGLRVRAVQLAGVEPMTEKMMTPLRQHMIDEMTIRNLSPSSEQGLARSDAVQHIGGAPAVMSLTLAQLEGDWIAVGVHNGVDFGRQPSARAPHASGCKEVPRGGDVGVLRTPFLTFAAC